MNFNEVNQNNNLIQKKHNLDEEPSIFEIINEGLKKLPDDLFSASKSNESKSTAEPKGPTLVKKR